VVLESAITVSVWKPMATHGVVLENAAVACIRENAQLGIGEPARQLE
jgi:hypothetical protein